MVGGFLEERRFAGLRLFGAVEDTLLVRLARAQANDREDEPSARRLDQGFQQRAASLDAVGLVEEGHSPGGFAHSIIIIPGGRGTIAGGRHGSGKETKRW